MSSEHSRRTIVSAFPFLFGVLSGCSAFNNDSRRVGFQVINHTDEEVMVYLQVYRADELLAEQSVTLGMDNSDSSSTKTDVIVDDLSENTKLSAEITVNEDRTESISFSVDCPVDEQWSGDGVAFRIREDYIESRDGCTTTEL